MIDNCTLFYIKSPNLAPLASDLAKIKAPPPEVGWVKNVCSRFSLLFFSVHKCYGKKTPKKFWSIRGHLTPHSSYKIFVKIMEKDDSEQILLISVVAHVEYSKKLKFFSTNFLLIKSFFYQFSTHQKFFFHQFFTH